MRPAARNLLRRLRYVQPFNRLATRGLRRFYRARGRTAPSRVVRHLHPVGAIGVDLPNGRSFSLNTSGGDDLVSNLVFWHGPAAYEPGTVELVARLAARSRCFLDIGAYVGFYSLLAATVNPEIDVYAFEPLPDVQRRLRSNIDSNHLGDRVQTVPAAVSDRNGVARFFRTASPLPTSSSLSEEFMRDTPDLVSTIVPVVSADAVVESLSLRTVDLVKIDVESTEHLVLESMSRLLSEQRPDIICEILPTTRFPSSVTERLRSLGYDFFLVAPDGPPQRVTELGGVAGAPNFWLSANP